MNKFFQSFGCVVIGCFSLLGCHRHEHGHGHSHGEGNSHSHGDDAKSFSGATHKEGYGITLLPQTKEQIGLQLVEVEEKILPHEIAFTVRVFSSAKDKQSMASGFISAEDAKSLSAGTPVTMQNSDGANLKGIVARSVRSQSSGETEVIIHFASEDSSALVGSFFRATARVDSEETVMTIPDEALIRGPVEHFVYVQNGDSFLRTVIESGRKTGNSVEVKDGLLEGDLVVTQGAMDLWLVELRAVKGGQGCCPAPPVKGKGQ